MLGFPPHLPVVVYSSAAMLTDAMQGVLNFFMTCDAALLQPHMDRIHAAASDSEPQHAAER